MGRRDEEEEEPLSCFKLVKEGNEGEEEEPISARFPTRDHG